MFIWCLNIIPTVRQFFFSRVLGPSIHAYASNFKLNLEVIAVHDENIFHDMDPQLKKKTCLEPITANRFVFENKQNFLTIARQIKKKMC